MKNSIKSLVALAALAALSLGANAQPSPKVLVVDMAKLYDTHYKTVEQNAKIQSDDQKAQEEVEKMNKEGNALVEEYKSLTEQSNNPALSADGKAKAQAAAQAKLEGIQEKQRAVQTFIQNTRNSLGQRLNNFRAVMLEDITKAATEMAKKKGANMLFDKSGPSGIGVPSLLFADAGFDITDDLSKELNKDRPAGAAMAPAAAPAAGATPTMTVPGITPKK